MWSPMIDVSEHQGAINFATMRARGVDRLILRVTHGQTLDRRVRTYYPDAVAAGYEPWQIGFYTFINPKRGSARATAQVTADLVHTITGRTDQLMMLDVENYRSEAPNRGTQPITGPAFAQYLRDWSSAYLADMPDSRIIAYSNRAYWNSADGPNDNALASELEWMVPRYPRYSTSAYERGGYPPDPPLWDEYALAMASGPYPPVGAGGWEGWQFSAGFNRQGARYGCQSSDLDLNIVLTSAAVRWWQAPNTMTPDPTDFDESDNDMQVLWTSADREGTWLIGSGQPVLLTPELVKYVRSPERLMPVLDGDGKVIVRGTKPLDKIVETGAAAAARWDDYLRLFSPPPPPAPNDPGTVPNVWRITGTIDAATDQA